jgi:hypothetical protein
MDVDKDPDLRLDMIGAWADRPWGEPWRGDPDVLTRAAEVIEIGLSRSMCYGMCPVYELVLERSGEARFEGKYFVAIMGMHTASLVGNDFDDLARAAIYLGFLTFEPRYDYPVTDIPTTTTWIRTGAERIEVSNRGRRGPADLGDLEDLIDGCAAALDWRPVYSESVERDGTPIFVGSTLKPDDLPFSLPGDRIHWTQRPRS